MSSCWLANSVILPELGHTTRACPEEATENPDKVEVKCVNCEEVGHRARDCTQPRKDRFACRNCKYVFNYHRSTVWVPYPDNVGLSEDSRRYIGFD